MVKVFSEPFVRLTFRQAVEDAKRAIREKGWDFVYDSGDTSCHNFDLDGSPSCVVGHIMAYEGMQLEAIQGVLDPKYGNEIEFNYAGIHTLISRGALQVDEEAQIFLDRMQVLQDEGETWGTSYTEALRRVYKLRKLNF